MKPIDNTIIIKTDRHVSRSRLELLLKRVNKTIEKQNIQLP